MLLELFLDHLPTQAIGSELLPSSPFWQAFVQEAGRQDKGLVRDGISF